MLFLTSMLTEQELRYMLALQRVPNLGDTSAKKLLHHVGSAEGVFKEKKATLLKIDGIGGFKLKSLDDKQWLSEADEELRFIKENDIAVTYFKDKNYPERLKHCLDGPILFFQVGNIGVLSNADIRFFLSVQKEALLNYDRHQPVKAIPIIDQIPLLPLYKNDVAFV